MGLRRTGDAAISIWIIVAIIAVIAIVVLAAVLVEADSPDMNAPDEDTKYQLVIGYKFRNWNHVAGIWRAPENSREFSVRVEDFDYEAYQSGSHTYFSIGTLGLIHGDDDNKFEYKLQLRVTGPNSFNTKDTWKLTYEIGEGNSRDINFGAKYCYVTDVGSYTVEAKMWVHAPTEDIPFTDDLDHALIWTHTRTVGVGA